MPTSCGISAIIPAMVLVTGGTGFIGSHLVEKLVSINRPPRLLLRPQKRTPKLIAGTAFDITVSGLHDLAGVRAAMRNVHSIIHLASEEQQWPEVDAEEMDVSGLQNLLLAAKEAGVGHILFLSRNGLDKNSSYPILRTKAACEKLIDESGLDYVIIRLGDVYGQNDHFTHTIASAMRYTPVVFPVPDGGKTILQPIWIEDLISILMLLLERDNFGKRIVEVGGGEYLEFQAICRMIMQKINKRKILIPVPSAYLRIFNLWIKPYRRSFPLPTLWLDLLAVDRICGLDSLPRNFEILPVRFFTHLDHLHARSNA
jgi:uncharacterized protein YbjT (DUF2867 family)